MAKRTKAHLAEVISLPTQEQRDKSASKRVFEAALNEKFFEPRDGYMLTYLECSLGLLGLELTSAKLAIVSGLAGNEAELIKALRALDSATDRVRLLEHPLLVARYPRMKKEAADA